MDPTLLFRIVGLLVAAGLHPVLTLLGLSVAMQSGTFGTPKVLAPLTSPIATILLGGLVVIEVLGYRLGGRYKEIAKLLTRITHLPLAIIGGSAIVASQLPTQPNAHIIIPAAAGSLAAGLLHTTRSARHKLRRVPVLSPLLSAFEGIAAAALSAVAVMAPAAVPVVLVAVALIGGVLSFLIIRRTAKLLWLHGERVIRMLGEMFGWWRPQTPSAGSPQPPPVPPAGDTWLDQMIDSPLEQPPASEGAAGMFPDFTGIPFGRNSSVAASERHVPLPTNDAGPTWLDRM